METNYILAIIFLAISIVALALAGFRVCKANREMFSRTYLYIAIFGVFLSMYTSAMVWDEYRDDQIDALKGKFKYRMEINYDQHGTPKDTIYVKDNYTVEPQGKEVVVVPVRPEIDTVIYINN